MPNGQKKTAHAGRENIRYGVAFLILLILLVIFLAMNVCIGKRIPITMSENVSSAPWPLKIFGISSTGIFTVPIHTFMARKITSRISRIKNATPYLILSLPACAVFFCPFGIFISCLSCSMQEPRMRITSSTTAPLMVNWHLWMT